VTEVVLANVRVPVRAVLNFEPATKSLKTTPEEDVLETMEEPRPVLPTNPE